MRLEGLGKRGNAVSSPAPPAGRVKKTTPSTFVDISTVSLNVGMNFTPLLTDKIYALSQSVVEIYLKMTNL